MEALYVQNDLWLLTFFPLAIIFIQRWKILLWKRIHAASWLYPVALLLTSHKSASSLNICLMVKEDFRWIKYFFNVQNNFQMFCKFGENLSCDPCNFSTHFSYWCLYFILHKIVLICFHSHNLKFYRLQLWWWHVFLSSDLVYRRPQPPSKIDVPPLVIYNCP